MGLREQRRAIEQHAYRLVKRNPTVRRVVEAAMNTARSSRSKVRPGAVVAGPRRLADEDTLDIRIVEPQEIVDRAAPVYLAGDGHDRFERERSETLPATGVTVLPGGRVWNGGQATMTAEGDLVGRLAYELDPRLEQYRDRPQEHPILREPTLSAPHRLPGRVAALSVPGGAGYYHWLIDLLPRLHLLEKAGFALDEIDTFVVNLAVADFQLETLALFGIGPDRIVTSRRFGHLQADELLAPDLPGLFGRPPRWVVDFLQARIAQPGVGDTDVYVSRRNAGHRQLLNNDAVESVVRGHAFEIVELENLTFSEQLTLLARTRSLCGTHGAGLTNIALCPPGGTAISLMSPHDPSHVYWTLANQCGATFAYSFGAGEVLEEADFDRVRFGSEDLSVKPDRLDELLQELLPRYR